MITTVYDLVAELLKHEQHKRVEVWVESSSSYVEKGVPFSVRNNGGEVVIEAEKTYG